MSRSTARLGGIRVASLVTSQVSLNFTSCNKRFTVRRPGLTCPLQLHSHQQCGLIPRLNMQAHEFGREVNVNFVLVAGFDSEPGGDFCSREIVDHLFFPG